MLQTRTDPVCRDETSSTGRNVNDVATRVVDDTTLKGPATTPEAVRTCNISLEVDSER